MSQPGALGIVTTLVTFRDSTLFNVQITLWLWFTALFANFAEAVAEGRGKAQAETLRRMRSETIAKSLVGVGDTSRHRRRGVHTVAQGEVVQRVQHRAALIPQRDNQIAGQHGRADAVLIADRAGIDAMANRLFVGVDQRAAG